MIIATLFMMIQSEPIGFDAYINRLAVPKVSVDEKRMNSRMYDYRRENPPIHIRGHVNEIATREVGSEGFINLRKGMARANEWDQAPRMLSSGKILGFETRLLNSESESRIYAHGNHAFITLSVKGLLGKGENRGEVVQRQPEPQNKLEIAETAATLFLAEHEAFYFAHTQRKLEGNLVSSVKGIDNTYYISVPAYAHSMGLNFNIDPLTGAGTIHSTPPLQFNLGSCRYHIGEQENTAEHIVVLKDGIAYVPEKMISR